MQYLDKNGHDTSEDTCLRQIFSKFYECMDARKTINVLVHSSTDTASPTYIYLSLSLSLHFSLYMHVSKNGSTNILLRCQRMKGLRNHQWFVIQ